MASHIWHKANAFAVGRRAPAKGLLLLPLPRHDQHDPSVDVRHRIDQHVVALATLEACDAPHHEQ